MIHSYLVCVCVYRVYMNADIWKFKIMNNVLSFFETTVVLTLRDTACRLQGFADLPKKKLESGSNQP